MVDQPEENHNGGQLAFGPDDRLYLGLGDGGGAFDPRATAQDPRNLLGKLVAADVDAAMPDWQVVLTGLRNPWRFWFDPALGEIWIGDVGQDEVEEIDRVPLELDEPPKNLGWSAFEGTRRIDGHDLDRGGELVWPVAVYEHGDEGGCSVTGGVVYGGGDAARPGPPLRLRRLLRRHDLVAARRARQPRRGRPPRARRRSRCWRTSAPTRTASWSSRRAPATSTGRSRPPARDRPRARSPGRRARRCTRSPGCQAGKPSRRLRSRSPLGSSSSTSWSCP